MSIENYDSLEIAQINLIIQNYIDGLRASWNPKMKRLDGKPFEGSVKGEEPFGVFYWDNRNAIWTHRNAAFKSYVFESILKYNLDYESHTRTNQILATKG